MNRAYHKGRKRPSQSAKRVWDTYRHPGFTAKLAKALGISKAAVSKWQQVPEDRLDVVAEIMEIPRGVLRPDLPDIHTTASVDDLYARSQPKEKA